MFQEKITTQKDLEEALKLSKRRQYEEERKKTIFNAKQRMFGIDLGFVERQMADNRLTRSKQLECKRRYEEQVRNHDLMLRAKELEQEKQRHLNESDLNRYRRCYQRKEQGRDFDLNDPDALKKAEPMRTGDNDLTLGISSAQIFVGEDLGFNERRHRQFEQQRAWLDQQIAERKAAENLKQIADREWQKTSMERDNSLLDMAISEKRVRSKVLDSVHEYNKQMAIRKREQRERAKQEKMEDDMAEIYNMLTSDMLTEDPHAGQSCLNPRKRVAFLYRGMTPEEMVRFRQAQAEQKDRIAKRLENAKLMSRQWEQYALNMDHELKTRDLELERREKKILNELAEFNSALAETQRIQNEKVKKMSQNVVTDEFFENFNTTSR